MKSGYSLWPHQVAAEPLLVGGSALLNWEMRLGKTREALHAYNELLKQGKVLNLVFVTVAMAKATIKQEVEEMGLGIPVITLFGQKKPIMVPEMHLAGLPCIYILNWEILPHWQNLLYELLDPMVHPFVLVLDESHLNLRNWQNQRYQAAHWLARMAFRVWELTGTAMVNSALDIYWQLQILGSQYNPFQNVDPQSFAEQYSNRRWNIYAANGQGDWDYVGIRQEQKLVQKLSGVMQQLHIKDVSDTPLPDHIARWITDLQQPWDFERDEPTLTEEIRALIPMKSKLTAEYVSALPFRPVVVFGWNVPFTQRVADLLEAPLINGSTPSRERERIRQEFQAGRHPVLVGNYRSLGLGISLAAADHFVYGEPYWDASLYLQAAARGVDLQKATQTIHHHLLAAGSVDEYVWKRKLAKGKAIEKLDKAFDLIQ